MLCKFIMVIMCNLDRHDIENYLLYLLTLLWTLVLARGHSRNQSKGGRISPQRYEAARYSDHFSQFIHIKSTERKPLQKPISAVFSTKLCINYCVSQA